MRIKRFFLKLITVLLAVVFAAVAFVLCIYVLWYVFDRPVVVFEETEISVEVGSQFDPESLLSVHRNIPDDHISVDAEELDLSRPGDYEVVFSIDAFPIGKQLLAKAGMAFISPDVQQQSVIVHVTDSEAPVLKTVKSPYKVKKGDTLKVDDLVKSVSDSTEVTVTFKDGSTKMKCDVEGEQTVTVCAADEGGNVTSVDVTLSIEGVDVTPPVISGADDLILAVNERSSIDLMEGITARDNKDGDVEVWIESGGPPDLDHADSGVIVYRADDKAGNESRVTRTIAVYDKVAGEGENRFGLLWDITGIENQPYLVAVNRIRNVVTVYGKGASGNYDTPVRSFICSVGSATPDGYFKTQERYRWHALWEDSFGQYATRITGHILFHSVPYEVNEDPSSLEYEEYNKLGTSASLGCVRMTVEDCKWIYENCPEGFVCVIFDDDLSNGPLGKPKAQEIDDSDVEKRGWDPTDPDPNNPWLK